MTNIEFNNYPNFFNYIKDKKVLVVSDINTNTFLSKFKDELEENAKLVKYTYFDEDNLVPDIEHIKRIEENIDSIDYVLGVGSGSINDLCKYTAKRNNIESGIFGTAPSMDGYLSKGAGIMVDGFKITYSVNYPHDCLVDSTVITNAPKILIASGFGDIIGKYTCLTDWRLSHILNGEEINIEAYEMMEKALKETVNHYKDIARYDLNGVSILMNALLVAGTSMAIAGNSRPASGSEHHQSHYIEMYFVKIKKPIPSHGLKVALGTLVSIELYNHLKETSFFKNHPKRQELEELIDSLPKVDEVLKMLKDVKGYTKFRELGITKELFIETIYNAYTTRDRYTILTLYHDNNLYDEIIDTLVDKYY